MTRSLTAGFRRLAAQARAANLPLRIFVSNDATSGYTDAAVCRLVLGCAVVAERVALEYGFAQPIVQFLAQGAAKPGAIPGYVDAWLHVVGTIPGDPADAGWHSLGSDNLPDGYVSTEGADTDTFSETLSHEINETVGDPNVNRTVTLPDGSTWPYELCDAVQASSNEQRIPVNLGDGLPPVQCANFVLKAYWDSTTPKGARVDYLYTLPGPIPAIGPYGYSAVTSAAGVTTDVFGERLTELPASKLHSECRYQVRKTAMTTTAASAAVT